MQRRSLTTSRHICTTDHSDDREVGPTQRVCALSTPRPGGRTGAARLAGVAGLATALLLGVGVAQAAPDAFPASGSPAATGSATAIDDANADPTAATTPRSARTGKATARERRSARDAIRLSIVERGLRQVGDRYASGAEGPDAFDCSGFTLFAWQGAGVQLTHYSAGQYQQVRRISPDAAVPGDLVFYLTGGARHVALYIGDGKIVHASDYGVGVIVSPVRGTPWTNAHFTGFGRVPIPDEAVTEMIEKRRARR